MPKQKKFDFKRLQGSSSNKIDASTNGGNQSSVNERLNELRLADPAAAAQKKREIAATVNQPTIPPALRSILGVPESAPPRARPGFRTRDRLRTPGPAPPTSWLRGDRSGSTPDGHAVTKKNESLGSNRSRPESLCRFAKLCGQRETYSTTSLSHYGLKQLARHWDLLDAAEYQSITILPSKVRTTLLSYLSFYGPAVTIEAFKALVHNNDTTVLDLAGLIGHDTFTLPKLVKVFKSALVPKTADAESWEEEETDSALFIPPNVTSFSSLTHLCLSNPPSTVRWHDLLTLTKHTPALTHLSLAYWPRPTLTPNLVTTTVNNQHGPDVVAGGSHFYSDFDQDLDEPRALLRQLSHNTLRLQWLDVEGNPVWLSALASSGRQQLQWSAEDATSDHEEISVELVMSWRNLVYVRCARPYRLDMPWKERQSGQSVTTTRLRSLLIPRLRMLAEQHGVSEHYLEASEQHKQWIQSENITIRAVEGINDFRKSHGCSSVAFDFGWNYQ